MPSVSLDRVTMNVRTGRRRLCLLNDVSWHIPAGSRFAILGQRGAGKTTLLNLLCGLQEPSEGAVDRQAVISFMRSPIRLVPRTSTPRQLIRTLSKVYFVDAGDFAKFVETFAELKGLLDTPMQELTRQEIQRFGIGLFYGVPCDFYLFDEGFKNRNVTMREKAQSAFLQRRLTAGMVLVTSSMRDIEEFDGTTGILWRGKLNFYATPRDAINVFSHLAEQYPEGRPRGHGFLEGEEQVGEDEASLF